MTLSSDPLVTEEERELCKSPQTSKSIRVVSIGLYVKQRMLM